MKIFRTLLQKDLKRILRNPTSVLIFIIIPLMVTALIGFAFGGMGKKSNQSFNPIKIGIVDEDESIFSQFLRSAVGQDEFREHFDASFWERETAIEMISTGELSAVLIIPEEFTNQFILGEEDVQLTLIKNPAQYIYPTIAQEGMEFIVTALNTIARNFREDLTKLYDVFTEERENDFLKDVVAVWEVADHAIKRLEAANAYLNPPLVTLEREVLEAQSKESKGPNFSLFSFLLIGMAAMFLLMIGDNSMRDLYRESRFRTLERFRTLREGLFLFVASKVTYTVVVLLIASFILFGGGSLIFGFQWQSWEKILLLVFCYSIFSAGFMGFIAALAGRERRADMFNSMLVIVLSMAGGCMWPPNNLPKIIREYITPYTPTFWFSDALRGLQSSYQGMDWLFVTCLLLGFGVLLIAGAASIFQYRLEKGIKE